MSPAIGAGLLVERGNRAAQIQKGGHMLNAFKAVLVVLTVIGIAINYAVEFSEWLMTPWQRAKNQ